MPLIVLNAGHGTVTFDDASPPIAKTVLDALDLAAVQDSLAARVALSQELPRATAILQAKAETLDLRRISLGLPRLLKR